MKKIHFLLLILFYSVTATSQQYVSQTEVKSIVSPRLISLNGGLRASVGGKSRTVVEVQLPPGTISWYYSFTTNPAGSGIKNLQLLMQLSAASFDVSGFSSLALSKIGIPAGSNTIDVFLLDQQDTKAFFDKADLNGGSFTYYQEGSITATKQGLVGITQQRRGPMYLGLKNPSSLEGIEITLEVVAIVRTRVYEDKWIPENIDKIYNRCLGGFLIQNDKAEQICHCFTDKITGTYTPSAYNQLSESGRAKLFRDETNSCSSETGNIDIVQKNERVRKLHELYRGQSLTKDYAGMELTLKELMEYGADSWETYNGLAFVQLCLQKYDEAMKALQMGLSKNSTALILLGNLGNYYLLSGKYNQAIELFRKYKNNRLPNRQKFKEMLAEDVREFERLGINNADFGRLRTELKID